MNRIQTATSLLLFLATAIPMSIAGDRDLNECAAILMPDENQAFSALDSQTKNYVGLVRKLVERGALDTEGLRAMVDAESPAPADVGKYLKMSAEEERFVVSRAFARLLSQKVNWEAIKRELSDMLARLSAHEEKRGEARDLTAPLPDRVVVGDFTKELKPFNGVGEIQLPEAHRDNLGNTFVYFGFTSDPTDPTLILNVKTRKIVRLKESVSSTRLGSPVTLPDGRTLAAAPVEKGLAVFDLNTGEVVKWISYWKIPYLRSYYFKLLYMVAIPGLHTMVEYVRAETILGPGGKPQLLVSVQRNPKNHEDILSASIDLVTGKKRGFEAPGFSVSRKRSRDATRLYATPYTENEAGKLYEVDAHGFHVAFDIPLRTEPEFNQPAFGAHERFEFHTTSTGKDLLIYRYRSGLYLYDIASKSVIRAAPTKGNYLAKSIVLEKDGDLWVCGTDDKDGVDTTNFSHRLKFYHLTDPSKDFERSINHWGVMDVSAAVDGRDGVRRVLLRGHAGWSSNYMPTENWLWDPLAGTPPVKLREDIGRDFISDEPLMEYGWGAFLVKARGPTIQLIQLYGPVPPGHK